MTTMQAAQDQTSQRMANAEIFGCHDGSTFLSTNPLPWTLIDVGLVETHAKCLPGDIIFVPYRLDNMLYHFPLPPSSKEAQPIAAEAVVKNPESHGEGSSQEPPIACNKNEGSATSVPPERGGRHDRRVRRKTRVWSANRNLPVRIDSLQAMSDMPPSYEESIACAQKQCSQHQAELERQNTLDVLENNAPPRDSDEGPFLSDVKRQLAETSLEPRAPSCDGPLCRLPPSRQPVAENSRTCDPQQSSATPRSRSASLPRRTQTGKRSRSPSIAKAQAVLGISQPEKTSTEQLFDQAVLEFQQQTPEVAERISQRNDIGLKRWASKSRQRAATLKEAEHVAVPPAATTIYVPAQASMWRPTAKIHRSLVHEAEPASGPSSITINTPALAKRLGVPIGTHASLKM